MKKSLMLFLILFSAVSIKAQLDISAGMGIGFESAASFRDYINFNFAPSDDQISTFSSTVEFFGEADYSLKEDFQLGFEYSYQIYSYNTQFFGLGVYDISYNHHRPTLLAYYVLNGEGYRFKFGGGAGLRYLVLDEKLPSGAENKGFSTTGVGFLLRGEGNTILSDNLYALISADVRYDMPGEPEKDGNKIYDSLAQSNVNLNSISFFIRLGISYFF